MSLGWLQSLLLAKEKTKIFFHLCDFYLSSICWLLMQNFLVHNNIIVMISYRIILVLYPILKVNTVFVSRHICRQCTILHSMVHLDTPGRTAILAIPAWNMSCPRSITVRLSWMWQDIVSAQARQYSIALLAHYHRQWPQDVCVSSTDFDNVNSMWH